MTDLVAKVEQFLAEHPTEGADAVEWLGARFDAGLAWVHFPVGLGGLGASRSGAAGGGRGLPAAKGQPNPAAPVIGYGNGMGRADHPQVRTDEQKQRYLPPLDEAKEWVPAVQRAGRRLRPRHAGHPRGA
ncbi:hypothetical protein [Kutzneria sp. 744]|uniref:hypothetical protein n=1 Tax=Kutzneria sp. (strain 744) TaxID=345341 RepID=UPI0004ACFD98